MQRRIGAHLSTSGGVDQAVMRAHEIGANALQVFSGSPRMWRRTSLTKIDAKKIWSNQEKYDVAPIFTHALYLVNLASDNPELVQKSMTALKHDLEFDAYIRGAGVVVHLGSHQGRGFEAVKFDLVQRMKEVLAATPEGSTFIIENSAGQNGKIASDLTEIKWLLNQLKSKRVKWCFDTCHGYAAGKKLVGPGSVLDEIENLDLLTKLACLHVNDTRDQFDSGRDRHANIGAGEIGNEVLGQFLRDPRISHVPMITEVPGLDNNGPDAENIKRLWQLVK